MFRVDRTARALCVLALLWASVAPALSRADLAASPTWFNPAWHYRVPITIPAAAAVNSTVVLNVDFNALLTQLGIASGSVDFDENSPRVVRPNGATATRQEFTDVVYNLALDAANNGRGEVRFLLEDAPGAGTYYLYFDIVGNGAKPANPATPINGNFEQSAGSVPTGWVTSSVNANGAQNDEVYRTALGSTATVAAGCQTTATSVSTSPNSIAGVATGQAWHLLGYRNNCEDGVGNVNELIRLSRDIAVPAGAAAGNLTFYFQVQGWDGIASTTTYDWVVFYVNGTPVNHQSLGINNTTTPQLVIDTNRLGRNNYSTTYLDHGWKLATLNLTPYAGTTINFQIEAHYYNGDNDYRSWVKIDDVAWSVQNGSVGTPQAFGANITRPNDTSAGAASVLTAGQPVALRVALDATASSVHADIYNQSGTLVASNRQLYDDGTHGDASAGDRIYTNDGSVAAQPTYTILATDPQGTAWKVRAFANDASISSVGAPNGLVQRPGQPATPVTQASYFNVDEQVFTVAFTTLSVTKTVATIRDPVNGATLPKAMPGASVQYQLSVVNQGPGAIDANTVVVIDQLSSNTAMCVTTACSGAASAVVYDDSGSPVPTGLTFNYATNVSYSKDGVTYTYTPVPDANGFDSAVVRVRIAPSGAMNAPGAGGKPSFVLRYVVRVK